MPSRARQLILTPKSPSICIYVYLPVTVSYGHLARCLEIISVAIPMASSCSIYFIVIFSPGPCKNPSSPRGCLAKWHQLSKRGPGNLGLVVAKALGSDKPFDCKIAGSSRTFPLAFYTEYILMDLRDNRDKGQ